jgi:hypothetical protein
VTAGTAEVWVLYPRTRTVVLHRADGTARRLSEDDEIEGGDLLPGLRAPIHSVFSSQ